jgi:hypothetical protein
LPRVLSREKAAGQRAPDHDSNTFYKSQAGL